MAEADTPRKDSAGKRKLASVLEKLPNFSKHSDTLDRFQLDKQFEALGIIGPRLLGLNIAGVCLLIFAVYGKPLSLVLGLWASVMGLTFVLWGADIARNRRLEIPTLQVKADRLKTHAYTLLILGLLWAIIPTLIWEAVGQSNQLAIGLVFLTIIFGTVMFSGSLLPHASRFGIPLAIGMCIPLLVQPSAQTIQVLSALLIFGFIVSLTGRWNKQQRDEQSEGEARLEEAAEHFGLLLKDFGQTTQDVLWQTNAQGRIIPLTISQQFRERSAHLFANGSDFITTFEATDILHKLTENMRNMQPFRDIVVSQTFVDGSKRWLSLSGKPIADKNKHFAGYRGVATDVTTIRNQETQLNRLTNFDRLTALPNRRYLHRHLDALLTNTQIDKPTIRAILRLDLDDFKWVNDTLGQDGGDVLIQTIASRLRDTVQTPHFCARLGGDEFAIVLECASVEAIKQTLVKLSQTLKQPYDLNGANIHCTTTIGVRVFPIDEKQDVKTLIKQAGLALSAAKTHKKGSWKVFIESMEDKANSRIRLEDDLRSALAKNALDVVFQPLFDAKTDRVVSVETLVRWNHPLKGQISPEEFISYAEDRGLIIELGDWILSSALRIGRQLPEDVRISINLSPLQLHSSQLISNIVSSLAHTGIAANRLELEITERIFMDNNMGALKHLESLKGLGVKIALDDFGTGFSSLAYLLKFPFDKLKIDKSFIDNLETDKGSRAITAATLSLAKSLGIRSTAEGIETQFQKDFLVQHGCDELQGYLMGKPMDISTLISALELEQTEDAARAREFALPRNLKTDWRIRA